MNESQAISAFAALAQDTRLKIVRHLVKAGGAGLASGAIARALKVSPASMSFHLGQLEQSGLVTSRRESRSIIYAANYPALGALIRFLMEDCCRNDAKVRACC
jgi:DNA-binding transcriptional ArsR family regulator